MNLISAMSIGIADLGGLFAPLASFLKSRRRYRPDGRRRSGRLVRLPDVQRGRCRSGGGELARPVFSISSFRLPANVLFAREDLECPNFA
jgi:hypothetical protein